MIILCKFITTSDTFDIVFHCLPLSFDTLLYKNINHTRFKAFPPTCIIISIIVLSCDHVKISIIRRTKSRILVMITVCCWDYKGRETRIQHGPDFTPCCFGCSVPFSQAESSAVPFSGQGLLQQKWSAKIEERVVHEAPVVNHTAWSEKGFSSQKPFKLININGNS